jgi:hypothetical protein
MMPAALLATAAIGLTPHLLDLAGATASSPQTAAVVKTVTAPASQLPAMPPSSVAAPVAAASEGGAVLFHFEKCGTYWANVPLRNPTGSPQQITLGVFLQGKDGARLRARVAEPEGALKIQPYATEIQKVVITAHQDDTKLLPASGSLLVAPNPIQPVICKSKTPDPECPPPPAPDPVSLRIPVTIPAEPRSNETVTAFVLLTSLSMAAVIVIVTAVNLRRKKFDLTRRMGSSAWNFGDSWGTNVTIGATLLSALLALTVFPAQPRLMDKSWYSILSTLLTAIVASAPIVYGMIRVQVQANQDSTAAINSQGYVFMFLISGGLVLWGATGQILTLILLTQEFLVAKSFGTAAGLILQALALAMGILVIIYGFRTLYGTVKGFSAPPADAGQPLNVPHLAPGSVLTEQQVTTLKKPLADWPLL